MTTGLTLMLAVALVSLAASTHASAIDDLQQTKSYCQPFRVEADKINDYRARNSSPTQQWAFNDNWKSHTWPAMQRMRNGDYSRPVMADLSFTLHGWPNHLEALKALVEYHLAGGKAYDFPPIACFFAHAQRSFPDDVIGYAMEGYYFSKVRKYDLAERAYRAALAVQPDSVDVHYNLGLLYVETKNFDSAMTQAEIAYGGGYPLPGLRKKLQQSGHWRDTGERAAQ